jgi:CheY-like chemotaxis protein
VPTAAPRVLVADDEDDIRALVGLAVRRAGCTVATEVPDGTQALAAARTDPPDLAVSMPGATA